MNLHHEATRLKQVITMSHSDSVSGTTIFNDGTKAYWTEGYSDVVFTTIDGKERRIPDNEQGDPWLDLMNEGPALIHRQMTFAEEIEWELARYGKLGQFSQDHYQGIEDYEKWS